MKWVDKRFAVMNSGISCLSLIFKLSNPRMKILHTKTRFKAARNDEPFTFYFSVRIYDLMVKAGRSESGLSVDMGSIPAGC